MFQPMKQGRERATRIVNGAGYKVGGTLGAKDDDREADIRMIRRAVGEHEGNMHRGEAKTRIKLKDGGFADGGMASSRMDQKPRSSSKKGNGPQINIIVSPNAGAQPPAAPPMMPPRPAPVMMPPKPPPGPPPEAAPAMPPMMPPPGGPPPGGIAGGPGMMPPGAPGPAGMMPRRPMGMRSGGNVGRGGEGAPAMTAGSGAGPGRLQKAEREGFHPTRRD